jgi:predicted phage terminase large subunit-like protein
MAEHLSPWIKAGIVIHRSETMSFSFPSGAIIEFSYIGGGYIDANQGLQYTTVIIDEITQNPKHVYDFWWTRLRSLKGQKHLPIQLLSAGNPGGIGNKWVVRHWGITQGEMLEAPVRPGDPGRYRWYGTAKDKLFLESELADNPALDVDRYNRTLDRLDPIRRKQIKFGDWSAEEDSRYKLSYFVYRWNRVHFSDNEHAYVVLDQTNEPKQDNPLAPGKYRIVPTDIDYVFTTVDVACSLRDGVNKTTFYESPTREIEPSYSVASTWAAAGPFLLLLDVVRIQAEAPQVVEMLRGVATRYPRSSFYMEENGVGKPTMQFFAEMGFPVIGIKTTADKLTNSMGAQHLCAERRIILPLNAPWLNDFVDEVTGWYGHRDQTDDQIDTLSNAAKVYGESPLSVNPRQLASLTNGESGLPSNIRPSGVHTLNPIENGFESPYTRVGWIPSGPTYEGFPDDYSFRSISTGLPVLSDSPARRIIHGV